MKASPSSLSMSLRKIAVGEKLSIGSWIELNDEEGFVQGEVIDHRNVGSKVEHCIWYSEVEEKRYEDLTVGKVNDLSPQFYGCYNFCKLKNLQHEDHNLRLGCSVESCNAWYHRCCLIKGYGYTQEEVEQVTDAEVFWRCPSCDKGNKNKKRKWTGKNKNPPPKRTKIEVPEENSDDLSEFTSEDDLYHPDQERYSYIKSKKPKRKRDPEQPEANKKQKREKEVKDLLHLPQDAEPLSNEVKSLTKDTNEILEATQEDEIPFKDPSLLNTSLSTIKSDGGEENVSLLSDLGSSDMELSFDQESPQIQEPECQEKINQEESNKEVEIPKVSKYRGVFWEKTKWEAKFVANGQLYIWPGSFDCELKAAHAVNRGCDILGIKRKNENIGDPPPETSDNSNEEVVEKIVEQEASKQEEEIPTNASKYCGVCWDDGQWVARFVVDDVIKDLGKFAFEVDAAHAVNHGCDKAGIARMNPGIGDPPCMNSADSDMDDDQDASEMKIQEGAPESKVEQEEDFIEKTEGQFFGQEEDVALKVPRRGSSKYHAVSWHAKKAKWQAQFKIDGKNIWCGTHASEVDAARAVNERCDALGIERKNPTVDALAKKKALCGTLASEVSPALAIERKDPPIDVLPKNVRKKKSNSSKGSSRYVAVYRVKESGKWRAHFSHGKKKHSCGTHLSEIDAAHAVNRKCDELGIARKNLNIGEPPLSTDTENETTDSSESEDDDCEEDQSRKKSSYVSVYWNKTTCKWRASFNYEKQTYYCGTYASEIEAAHAINRRCDDIGISRRNPGIGNPPSLETSGSEMEEDEEESSSELEEVENEEQNKTSKYKAVYYIKARDRWFGSFTSGGEKKNCGEHATAFNAALAVNRRCDELRITRKNPNIGERTSENASDSESDSEPRQEDHQILIAAKKIIQKNPPKKKHRKKVQLRPGATPDAERPLRIAVSLKEPLKPGATASEIEKVQMQEEIFLMPNGHVMSTEGWHEPLHRESRPAPKVKENELSKMEEDEIANASEEEEELDLDEEEESELKAKIPLFTHDVPKSTRLTWILSDLRHLRQKMTIIFDNTPNGPEKVIDSGEELRDLLYKLNDTLIPLKEKWLRAPDMQWMTDIVLDLPTEDRTTISDFVRKRKSITKMRDVSDWPERWFEKVEVCNNVLKLWFKNKTLDEVVKKAVELGHFEMMDLAHPSYKLNGKVKETFTKNENLDIEKLKEILRSLPTQYTSPVGDEVKTQGPNGEQKQRFGVSIGEEDCTLNVTNRTRTVGDIGVSARMGSLRTVVNYPTEDKGTLLDDYWRSFRKAFDDPNTDPIEINPTLYFLWKFYQYATAHHQDTHVPPHYTIYNQISGYSCFHNLPLLVGLFVGHVAEHGTALESAELLTELNRRGYGSITTVGPGDMLLVLPNGSHGVWVPTVWHTDDAKYSINGHLKEFEVSAVRAAECYVQPLLNDMRTSFKKLNPWIQFPAIYRDLKCTDPKLYKKKNKIQRGPFFQKETATSRSGLRSSKS